MATKRTKRKTEKRDYPATLKMVERLAPIAPHIQPDNEVLIALQCVEGIEASGRLPWLVNDIESISQRSTAVLVDLARNKLGQNSAMFLAYRECENAFKEAITSAIAANLPHLLEQIDDDDFHSPE